MIQNVPPEILAIICRHAAPGFFATEDRSEARQGRRALATLRLIDRRFEQVATGIMFRHLRVAATKDGLAFLRNVSSSAGLARVVRTVSLSKPDTFEIEPKASGKQKFYWYVAEKPGADVLANEVAGWVARFELLENLAVASPACDYCGSDRQWGAFCMQIVQGRSYSRLKNLSVEFPLRIDRPLRFLKAHEGGEEGGSACWTHALPRLDTLSLTRAGPLRTPVVAERSADSSNDEPEVLEFQKQNPQIGLHIDV